MERLWKTLNQDIVVDNNFQHNWKKITAKKLKKLLVNLLIFEKTHPIMVAKWSEVVESV